MVATFYRVCPNAPAPSRASRDALGSIPARAAKYCDAITRAGSWGWYIYPPYNFSLFLESDGTFLWRLDDDMNFEPIVDKAYVSDSIAYFNSIAPSDMRDAIPAFIEPILERGIAQIWMGYFVHTIPEWSLMIRSPVHLPQRGYELFEGIIEADKWLGPLFINLRLTRTGAPVKFTTEVPLLQILPVPRQAYSQKTHQDVKVLDQPNETAWEGYKNSIVKPNLVIEREVGAYAKKIRQRNKKQERTVCNV